MFSLTNKGFQSRVVILATTQKQYNNNRNIQMNEADQILTVETASATSVNTVGLRECSRILLSTNTNRRRLMVSSGPRFLSRVINDAPLQASMFFKLYIC